MRARSALLVAAGLAPALAGCGDPPPAAAEPALARPASEAGWFSDATSAWGLDFVHDAGATPEKHLPETMGAGAALLDVDQDGDLDVYFVQSGPLPIGAARERTSELPHNRLYRNAGGGRFVDDSEHAGDAAHRGYGMGVAAGDADGDGDDDMFVTNLGPDALFLNDGGGRFDDATSASGIDDRRWTAGALFFDADQDGDLDLFVTGYLDVDLEHPSWCGRREPGWRSYCHPDHYAGIQDRLWKNDGRARFENATDAAGLADSAGKGLGAIAVDLDLDGDLELYVANDSVENRLWENQGDGTFVDATLVSGTGVDGRGATEAGMGLAAGDVDQDGRIDLFVTNFDHESSTLYRNLGAGLFSDATAAAGLEAASRMPVGFGVVLEDFDADGDIDLAVANGHIIDNIELYDDGQRWRQHAQLFVAEGDGRFRLAEPEAGELARDAYVGRGLYSGDLDGDGDPDLLLTQCGGPARAFRNDAQKGGGEWIDGLPPGTTLAATTSRGRLLVRIAGGAPSYLGRSASGVYLGLPAGETLVSLRARRPGGALEELRR